MNVALIQARIGSSRLPSKVLKQLGNKTVLEHVVSRVSKASLVDEVFVLTTIEVQDLSIVKFCSENNIRVFVGSENDVLDRFYQCSKLLKPNNIIRITSDCPLIDPDVIDHILKIHIEGDYDYTSNTLEETYPDGLDAEVVKYSALEKAWEESRMTSEREHVTPYIKKNGSLFSLKSVKCKIDLSEKRWTIDNEEDYRFLSNIFSAFDSDYFNMDDVLDLLKKNPEWESINSHLIRNEGYQKSLNEDKRIK